MRWQYEQLQDYLRHFVNIDNAPVPYDFNGIVHLMLALADNLQDNASEFDLEGIRESMTDEQAAFFLKLADYIRNYKLQ